MDNLPYADIVILALIAGFILLRLRSVLGQKTDSEGEPFFKPPVDQGALVQIREKPAKSKPIDEVDPYLDKLNNAEVAGVLADIKKIDGQFSATAFLSGAKMAYEMIFDAFARGDKKTLEMLLDKPLYETFAREIDGRAQSSQSVETTLVSVRPKDITQAALVGNTARLTVAFASEQVSLVKDAEGKIVEGDASHAHLMDDEWVFERDVTSKNPNWKIIET